MNSILLLLLPILIFMTCYILKKYSLGLNYTGQPHQKFAEKKQVPLVGGIFIVLITLIFNYNLNVSVQIHLFLIFILGFLSDFKILNSPAIRFLSQIIIIVSFVYFNEVQISDTRVLILDKLLNSHYFNFAFVVFCMMIIVNGSNFIDGLNTILLGYYLIISINFLNSDLINDLSFISSNFNLWVYSIFILFIFNFFRKIFMGDSGAYTLGLLFSYIIIEYNNLSDQISPFFIVLLAWYPCYEILFSIIRKFKFGLSPIKADNKHFHQLLFNFFSKKLNLKKIYINTFTGMVINTFNFIVIYLGFLEMNNTQYQILLILFSIILYTFLYLKLFSFRYKF